MRLARRYICIAVILTSLVWLLIDIAAYAFKDNLSYASHNRDIHEDISPVDAVGDIVVGNKEHLVTIDYFKQYYKTSLNPQPGSAGMGGDAVVNSAAEKQKEDTSLNDYGFNELASSKISLERTIPDNRAQA